MPNKQTEEKSTPYELGYRAHRERKGSSTNPYPHNTADYDSWYAGWMQNDREDTH